MTRADSDGLVLGFELQDGPKSMADIVLGKVQLLKRRLACYRDLVLPYQPNGVALALQVVRQICNALSMWWLCRGLQSCQCDWQ